MNNEDLNTSIINPVDFYNFNCIQDAFDMMIKVKGVEYVSIDAFAFVKNKGDNTKRMIVLEDGFFIAKMENGLNLEVGKKYTPFMMLQKFKFKNSFLLAMNDVIHYHMGIVCPYVRVGTKYFKTIDKVDRYGVKRTELVYWDKQTLLEDHPKQFIEDIDKYDDFTIVPNNKNYHGVIGNNYNLYSPFEHEPCDEFSYMGEIGWYWTKTLLEHIFGEQYELGIKYLKVLYDKPWQPLPILVLISEERSTGKTTFVDFLNIMFGANMVIINPQDIGNSFNGSYADKNIIAIEESRFDNVQSTEKLKNLATQKEILVNSKHIRQYTIPFYGKLIITSNDETKFSKVDTSEIRYWVRKIPTLQGKANHNILNDFKNEIPQFLYYLDTLEDVDTSKSRMVFTPEEIGTNELESVKKESRSGLHKDIELCLEQHCIDNPKIEEFLFTAMHIKGKFFLHNNKYELNYINKILKDDMKLERGKMQRFVPLQEQDSLVYKKTSGTPYTFKNNHYNPDFKNEETEY